MTGEKTAPEQLEALIESGELEKHLLPADREYVRRSLEMFQMKVPHFEIVVTGYIRLFQSVAETSTHYVSNREHYKALQNARNLMNGLLHERRRLHMDDTQPAIDINKLQ